MKKLGMLIGALFVATFSEAHLNNTYSDLNLKLWNNSQFIVVLDHYDFNKTNSFYLENLKPGLHILQVIKLKKNHNGYGFIKQVLYNGILKVPAQAKMKAIVTVDGQLQVSLVKKHPIFHENECNHGNVSSSGYTNNYQGGAYIVPMPNSNFDVLMQAMESAHFDSSKMDIAKQALNGNNFTTNQITLLIGQFSFESNKLAFAKLAYAKTIDPQNYFIVTKEFSFSSSIDSLNEYINSFS